MSLASRPLIKAYTLESALIPVPDSIPITCIARMTENMTQMVNFRHTSAEVVSPAGFEPATH